MRLSLPIVLTALLLPVPAIAGPLPLVPLPASVMPHAGSFTITAGQAIGYPARDAGAAEAGRLLAAQIKTQRGLALTPSTGTAPIRFVRDSGVKGREAYRLTVGSGGVTIAASGDAGLLYGAMTLAQLASPDDALGQPVTIAGVEIADAPRFGWRGLMLDVARHFQPIGEIYKIVDQMAAVKLNTLHLHLTDDQGWRFEVKRYPRLTEIGAWRRPPSTGGAAPETKVGGFYTQAQLKELVAYAARRGITIVPEVDLPGHAQALVAAYPEFGVLGDQPQVGHDWGVNPYLFNPGRSGVTFVENILDELMAVFPGTYVHLGGDEAVKDQWERSPAVQAEIKKLGLNDENALQSWLIDQFGDYLAKHGRRLIGWDEILEGGLPSSASVMSWRGEKGAIDAANAGHDVVLSPAPTLYLDHVQSDHADEPPGQGGAETLADVYAYDPMPAAIAPAERAHVLGAQANAWSEYIVTPYQLEHRLFPRIGAVAELGWTPQAKRDFTGFLPRIDAQDRRWRRAGVEVADSAFAVSYALQGTRGDALRHKQATVSLATQAPYGTIHYTTDGTAPTVHSRGYQAPLTLPLGTVVRAAAFRSDGSATAAPRPFDASRAALLTRSSSEMAACPKESLFLRLPLTPDATANAQAYNTNVFDTCSVYPAAPLDVAKGFTVDVARLARNFGLAHDSKQLRWHYNVTPYGELEVLVGCPAEGDEKDGDKAAKPVVAATFPLPDPATSPQRFSFTGTLPPGTGDADLCFLFTSPLGDPLYAVGSVRLLERGE
ncbi:MAG: beta-N-acetylhexosaminidase [Sphingomonas sp.]